MRVFNLTDTDLDFRGKTLAPHGGNQEYPELDVSVTDRDRALVKAGKISFGALPLGWRPPYEKPTVKKIEKVVLPEEPIADAKAPKKPWKLKA